VVNAFEVFSLNVLNKFTHCPTLHTCF